MVNIMYQMSIPLVISVGLTYVLLLGSIDLSIEGVMGFAGSFVAFLVVNNSNSNDFGILGILFVILISTFIGAITGIIHVKARIATFIVTYAVGSIMTGVPVLVYQARPSRSRMNFRRTVTGEIYRYPLHNHHRFCHLHHRRADPQLYGLWKGCVCNWR